jgi:alpha-tubulin suppressor-like RCC1 family protein
LEIGVNENSDEPKLIELKNFWITKISSGKLHNLLLSNDGVICGFGDNHFGQIGILTKENQIKPTKLNHEKKFIDIASHWNYSISIALSGDNVFYIWGEFYKDFHYQQKQCLNHSMKYSLIISSRTLL